MNPQCISSKQEPSRYLYLVTQGTFLLVLVLISFISGN